MDNRVVVTGLGLICAIGASAEESFLNAVKGTNGIRKVKSVDTTNCYATIGAEADFFETPDGEDRASALAVHAAREAVNDAKLTMSHADRVGVILGSCVGGAVSIETFYRDYLKDADSAKKEDVLKMPISAIANNVARAVGAKGVINNIANACAAGTMSIIYASELIRSGKADAVIAGGSDPFSSLAFSGFTALHALDEQPCRPFNRSSGISLGEGAGILIIESYTHAKQRGAKIYCEVLGGGVSSDAYHITASHPEGEGQRSAMLGSLKHSGLTANDIDYINAHGTGTPLNDASEGQSMLAVFGGNPNVSASSTKSMVGHCLGAAGSVEAVFCVKAIEQGMMPPTIGFTDEDIEASRVKTNGFDYVPNTGRAKPLSYIQSNNYAFGGNNASVIYAKEDSPRALSVPNTERILLTGLGVAGPLGNTAAEVEAALQSGRTGALSDKLKDTFMTSVNVGDFDAAGLKLNFYRKLDRLSQLVCVSGKSALKAAGIEIDDGNRAFVGIVAGTSDGPQTEIGSFQKGIIQNGVSQGSAFVFPNTVYNAAAGYLSICTGIKGYNVTVTNGFGSGLDVASYAFDVLKTTEQRAVLAVGADETSETVHVLYDKLGVFNGKFRLSEGATTLVLEKESSARARGAAVYGELLGFGHAHEDAAFGELGGVRTLEAAAALALKAAGIDKSSIDLVYGFSNGLSAADQVEAAFLNGYFAGKTAYANVKPYTGEGRAASSALSVAAAAMELNRTNKKYALIISYAAGGSYTAAVVKSKA